MKGERRRLNLSEKELLENIEWLRKKLNAFAMPKSLIDQEVINMSRILDQMLNQYYVLTNEKGSPYPIAQVSRASHQNTPRKKVV